MGCFAASGKKISKFGERAPLPFPANPFFLAGIEKALSLKIEEGVLLRRILFVEPCGLAEGAFYYGIVFFREFAVRVLEFSQQCKVKVFTFVSKIVCFDFFKKIPYVFFGCNQGWNDHHGCGLFGYPFFKA